MNSAPRSRTLALLAFAAVAVAALTLRRDIQPNDEGLMLQAAARIAHGQVPYRDFWWFYPPGQPYLLAALWKIFGPSLLTWRVVRAVADTVVAVFVYRLARTHAPARVAAPAWAIALLALVYPSGPHPYPIALACALGALLTLERSPATAGVLAGVCAAWRIEFAVYLSLGALLGLALAGASVRGRVGASARFAVGAMAAATALYAPVVIGAGIGPSWRLLVRYPLEQFSAYQGLPLPFWHPGRIDTSSVRAFLGHSSENLLLYYLPVVALAGAAAALLVLARRVDRGRPAPIAAGVLTAGTAHYLLIRPDVFHTAPLVCMLCVVGPWAIATEKPQPRRTRRLRVRAPALALVVAGALGYALVEGLDRQRLLLAERVTKLRAPSSGGVEVAPAAATPLALAVRAVRARVPPGRSIYVTGVRSDLVSSGNPLFYILADRPNPTRYDIAAPGVVTTAGVQREIVAALERTRTEVVVRWLDPVTAAHEPNRSGHSSGVHTLDDYIAERYRPFARYAYYSLLERTNSVIASATRSSAASPIRG